MGHVLRSDATASPCHTDEIGAFKRKVFFFVKLDPHTYFAFAYSFGSGGAGTMVHTFIDRYTLDSFVVCGTEGH